MEQFPPSNTWENRSYQVVFLCVILIISTGYMALFSWYPLLKMQWNVYNEKSAILSEVRGKLNNGTYTSKATTVPESVEGAASDVSQLRTGNEKHFKLEMKPVKNDLKVIKRNIVSNTLTSQSQSSNTKFELKGKGSVQIARSDNVGSTNAIKSASIVDDSSTTIASNSSRLQTSFPPRAVAVNPSHYAPAPVIRLSEAQKTVLQARRLKEQQDALYAQSVARDEEKRHKEQVAAELLAIKAARIASMRDTPRTPPSGDDAITLSFRFNSNSVTANSSGIWIKDGNVHGKAATAISTKVTAVFSIYDTIEYVLDYVQGLDAFHEITTGNSAAARGDEILFDLSLSYPTRVINRGLDPKLTLRDVNVTTDSVVWVTLKD